MPNKTSQHILSTSANLLGFCLFVITSIHLSDKALNNQIDEFTSIIALMLTISSLFSFLSIKTEKPELEHKLEGIADYFFFFSLFGIFGILCFIIVSYWGK